jgi:hypothetical protein
MKGPIEQIVHDQGKRMAQMLEEKIHKALALHLGTDDFDLTSLSDRCRNLIFPGSPIRTLTIDSTPFFSYDSRVSVWEEKGFIRCSQSYTIIPPPTEPKTWARTTPPINGSEA